MSESRLTNLTYLREITGGEPEIMKEFIQMFFDQIPEFRKRINKTSGRSEMERAWRTGAQSQVVGYDIWNE